jgi:hypothetical protein
MIRKLKLSVKVKIRINCIIEYLNKKQNSDFSGSVKLSFENGEIVAVSEANKHDLPLTVTTENNIVAKCLKMATEPLFNGAVVFFFADGKVTGYSYSKSYKGETLKKFLGA